MKCSIDGFLGIAYGQRVGGAEPTTESARTDLGAFIRQLRKFRLSMPPPHREMVNLFESEGNCRQFIAKVEELINQAEDGQLDSLLIQLKVAYNECIENLVLFRRVHTEFATNYIKKMAATSSQVEGEGLTTHSSPAALKGTGGSDFATHLSRHVADTRKSLYAIKPLIVEKQKIEVEGTN